MDVLVSIPLVTYFLSPSVTSWSTSLNLLFFYMTWTTLILSHAPLKVHLVGLLAIRLILYLIPSLLTLLFDVAVPSLAETIKYEGNKSLPPRDFKTLSRLVGLAVFNVCFMTGVEGAFSLAFAYTFKEPEFKTSTTLPLPWQMAKHMFILLLAREVLVFYIKRSLLHVPKSKASNLSRLHQSYAHTHAGAPYSLQLFTDHPLPLLVHRWLPIYLPALILRPHLLTYFLFVAFCTAKSTLGMSGYSVVPAIITGRWSDPQRLPKPSRQNEDI